jgi:hypothetical protein
MNKNSLQGQILIPFNPFLLLATRWLWWQDFQRDQTDESGVFLCGQHHFTMVFHAHVSLQGLMIVPLVAAVQRRSLTLLTWPLSSSLSPKLEASSLTWLLAALIEVSSLNIRFCGSPEHLKHVNATTSTSERLCTTSTYKNKAVPLSHAGAKGERSYCS